MQPFKQKLDSVANELSRKGICSDVWKFSLNNIMLLMDLSNMLEYSFARVLSICSLTIP